MNPPLNFYLTLPAIGLADLFGISDTNGQYLALGLLLFASLAWSAALLRETLALPPLRHAMLVAGMGAAMVLSALNNMGQREQLLVIFAMPWAVGLLGGAGGRAAIPRAAAAAVGVCLKPHFLLLPVAVTLWRLVVRRSLRPVLWVDNLVFIAVGAAYVANVALIHPAYFTDIVPMARAVYGAYGAPMENVIAGVRIELMLLAAAILVTALSGEALRQVVPFWSLSAAGLGIYVTQGTGFGYHAIPFLAFGMVACAVVIATAARISAAFVAAALAFAVLSVGAVQRGPYTNLAAEQIARVAGEVSELDSVMVLTTYVHAGPPAAIAAGADWASSYSSNWLVPGAVNRIARTDCAAAPDLCERLRAIAARNRSDNLDDIETRAPDLLVIDRRSGYFDTHGFDWPAFMDNDPRWSRLFSAYAPLHRTNRFAYYRRARTNNAQDDDP